MPTDLRRLVETLFQPATDSLHPVGWRPSADIYRVQGGWLAKFDLAGVRPEDIRVTVSGRYLTVRGSRHDWQITEGVACHSMEIAYSDFERSIEFPADLEQAQIVTEYRDGMLYVRLLTTERS
jgi:HSP20 family protein